MGFCRDASKSPPRSRVILFHDMKYDEIRHASDDGFMAESHQRRHMTR